jgi:thioredoxin reductase (NADPH)
MEETRAQEGALLDCIVIGGGPGGLQAAIYLGRYNFKAVLFNTFGGRTGHAKHLENYLGIPLISGTELLKTGIEQAKRFGVVVRNEKVDRVSGREGGFEVQVGETIWRSRYIIAASGANETIAPFKNLPRFFGHSYHTCMICDGYRMTGKKIAVIDRTANGVRMSVGMKRMYTNDVTFIAHGFSPAPIYRTLLEDEGIGLVEGRPEELMGATTLEGVRMQDGRVVPCEAILGWGGITLNDKFLEGLDLERDAEGFKIAVKPNGESSISGLFVVGALRAGHSQAIISAGQGAEAAIEISTRIVEI